jgi:hypothetical protein
MKALHSITTLVALLALAPLCRAQREFISSDGKKLLADLVSASDAEVTLKRASDGKEFKLALDRLSEADQGFVKEWLEKKKRNTRPVRQFELTLKGGETRTVDVPEGEYLAEDGTLTLCPGDTIHLEFDEAGKPQVVSEVKDPRRTVTFSMSHKEDMTMLSRSTKMKETVAMDCTHRGVGSEKFARTNLHPTEKGLAAFDSWPGSVWTLKLSNFEVTDRSASEVYQERVSK